jgi:hypothetical protein
MTTPDLLTPWRYYVDSRTLCMSDAELVQTAALLVGAYEGATARHSELQQRHADETTAYCDLRQQAAGQLAAAVSKGKGKPSAADFAQRLTQHRDQLAQLELELQLMSDCIGELRADLAKLVAKWREYLLVWVAREREAVGLTVCGNVMPMPVKLMHALLDVPLDPRWDEQLQLPSTTASTVVTSSRQLPLEWAATDPQQVRASLAWVWQQLAAGNMRRVNVPARHYPNTGAAGKPREALRLTQPVDVLPVVPVVRDRHKP